MSSDPTITALRNASPRNQPGFDEWVARRDALRQQITATPVPGRGPAPRLASRRRLIGLSMAATVLLPVVAVIVAVTVSASSPASALAAARRALAATAAATSGTMTMTFTRGSSTWTVETTRWNGDAVAFSSRSGILGPNRQLLLVGGGAYVLRADGRWLHYSTEKGVGELGAAVELAHANVSGNAARQVLALAENLKRSAQPDGITVYTGTIPTRSVNDGINPASDTILRLIENLRTNGSPPVSPNPSSHPSHYHALQLEMTVASNGLVKDISLTIRPTTGTSRSTEASSRWRVSYTQLGHAPAITPPATSTQTPPVIMSPRPACPPPPHGPCGG